MQPHNAESLSEQIAKHISEQIIRGELVEESAFKNCALLQSWTSAGVLCARHC